MGNKSDTVYEYKKVKPLEKEDLHGGNIRLDLRRTINKINELCIEQNHLMKDFELYKKAFKQHELYQREVIFNLLDLITDIVRRVK